MSSNSESTKNNKKRTFTDVIKEHNEHMNLFNVTLEELNYIDEDDTKNDYILNNFKKQKNMNKTKCVTFKD